jgi:nucleoside-diphosphate-sugar epimerase
MGVNYVSPNDVADAAMVVLLDRKKHRNTIYEITGRGPTIDADLAKMLTEHYGTDIEHIELGYRTTTRTTSRNEAFVTGWSETRQPLRR